MAAHHKFIFGVKHLVLLRIIFFVTLSRKYPPPLVEGPSWLRQKSRKVRKKNILAAIYSPLLMARPLLLFFFAAPLYDLLF